MLDGWEENLAILTANRTTDDELVIIHLGDCLWKERGQVFCLFLGLSSFLFLCLEKMLSSLVLSWLESNCAEHCCTHMLFGCRSKLWAIFRQCKTVSSWCGSLEISTNICQSWGYPGGLHSIFWYASSLTDAWFAYTYDWHVLIVLLIVLWSLQKFCFHSSSVFGQKYVAVCFWRM